MKRQDPGFTLVELIVVIAILGILSGIGVAGYSGYIQKANKAADEVLLGALNSAFQVASVEGGDYTGKPANGSATLDGDGKVTSVTSAVDADGEIFKKYFKGNENSAFKEYTNLFYDRSKGAFSGNTVEYTHEDGVYSWTVNGNKYEVTDDQMAAIKASNYSKNMAPSEVTHEVGTVVDAAATVVNNPGMMESILNNIMGDGYASGQNINADDPDYAQKLSNALVIGVANQITTDYNEENMSAALAQMTSPATIQAYSTLTPQGLTQMVMGSKNGLSNLAVLYGLMAGYANSEAGKDVKVDGEQSLKSYFDDASADLQTASGGSQGLKMIVDMATTMTGTSGFDSYMANEATADFQGLISAMNVVKSNESSLISTGALTNGFDSGDINGILNMIMTQED